MKLCLSCVVAFGLWFSLSSAHAQQGQVKAESGGIAIGGSVTDSTINIGLPQEKVDALVRDRTRPLEELLKEKLDLNERQVRRALDIIGEANVPPERLAAKLVEVAEHYKVLLTGSAAQPGDSPNVIDLKGEAQKAIDAGDLGKADALLARVETEQRLALDRSAGAGYFEKQLPKARALVARLSKK
jgi:hypothetical protein